MLLSSSIKATTKHKLGKTYAHILISALSMDDVVKDFFQPNMKERNFINATNTTKAIDW